MLSIAFLHVYIVWQSTFSTLVLQFHSIVRPLIPMWCSWKLFPTHVLCYCVVNNELVSPMRDMQRHSISYLLFNSYLSSRHSMSCLLI